MTKNITISILELMPKAETRSILQQRRLNEESDEEVQGKRGKQGEREEEVTRLTLSGVPERG